MVLSVRSSSKTFLNTSESNFFDYKIAKLDLKGVFQFKVKNPLYQTAKSDNWRDGAIL